jgi:hypothetical protein
MKFLEVWYNHDRIIQVRDVMGIYHVAGDTRKMGQKSRPQQRNKVEVEPTYVQSRRRGGTNQRNYVEIA